MKTVNIQAAKTHLSRLVDSVVEGGEEVVLAKAGKPMVRLVPYVSPRPPRIPGLLAGQVEEAPGCWDSGDNPLYEAAKGPMFHGAVEEPPQG